jgi:hypothetical protein
MHSTSGLRGERNEDRIPGVPNRTGLGASKNEALALAGGALALVIIFASFWFAATH